MFVDRLGSIHCIEQMRPTWAVWVDAIRRHLPGRQRWGWLPGWRWWQEQFLPGMPPRQRRIVRMIVWVGVLEFVVFLFVAAIFRAELHSGS